MTNNIAKSRLEETSFSTYNLRDAYITNQAEYIAALRDEALFSNYGIAVLIRVPSHPNGELNENNVDEYSNFVDDTWLETTERVIPKFDSYRINVSEEGMSADGSDGIYPLEIMIPTKLHLPRNSRIVFNEYNSREEKIAREWTVLSTSMKQLSGSKTYTRLAYCVPARQDPYETSELSSMTMYFDYTNPSELILSNIRCHGTLFFTRASVDSKHVRVIMTNAIEEDVQIAADPINEDIVKLVYYSNQRDTITEGGFGFKENEIYSVYDQNREPVLINVSSENYAVPLQVRIAKVDTKYGVVEEIEFLHKFSYSAFDNTKLMIGLDHPIPCEFTLSSVTVSGQDIDENVLANLANVVISAPIMGKAATVHGKFSSKAVSIAVLN